MLKRRFGAVCALLLLAVLAGACQGEEGEALHDGYYSAVTAAYNQDGWKEFVTLYIYNNRIITAEYSARNPTGMSLGWDVLYLRRLKERLGAHPNHFIREYTRELLARQKPEKLRRVRGDTFFYETFKILAGVALEQARLGDKSVKEVPLSVLVGRYPAAPPRQENALP